MNNNMNSIQFLMSLEGLTPNDLADLIPLSERTIYKMRKGADNVYVSSLKAIADYFNLPSDLIIERNVEKYKIVKVNNKYVIQYTDDENMDMLIRLIRYQQLLDK